METGSERCSDLPEATQWDHGRCGIRTQVCLTPDLTSLSWSYAHSAKNSDHIVCSRKRPELAWCTLSAVGRSDVLLLSMWQSLCRLWGMAWLQETQSLGWCFDLSWWQLIENILGQHFPKHITWNTSRIVYETTGSVIKWFGEIWGWTNLFLHCRTFQSL